MKSKIMTDEEWVARELARPKPYDPPRLARAIAILERAADREPGEGTR